MSLERLVILAAVTVVKLKKYIVTHNQTDIIFQHFKKLEKVTFQSACNIARRVS